MMNRFRHLFFFFPRICLCNQHPRSHCARWWCVSTTFFHHMYCADSRVFAGQKQPSRGCSSRREMRWCE
uniref:Putative secreted protein n=1 Tax=Anopheles triannulatus TaxID=58253 RepID=A0A2M4B695_9DIPT